MQGTQLSRLGLERSSSRVNCDHILVNVEYDYYIGRELMRTISA